MNKKGDNYRFSQPKTSPLLDVILNPGDVLYVPPFFPHEGVTQEESISIAFAWKGITYFHLLGAINPQSLDSLIYDKHTAELFDLVPDYKPNNLEEVYEIATEITQRISRHNVVGETKEKIINRLCRLMLPQSAIVS